MRIYETASLEGLRDVTAHDCGAHFAQQHHAGVFESCAWFGSLPSQNANSALAIWRQRLRRALTQVVGADANLLTGPLLILLLGLRSVRQNDDLSERVQRRLEEFVRALNGHFPFARFGLPDRVQASTKNLFDD